MVSCRVDAGFFSATSSRRLPVKLAAPFWGGSFSEIPKHLKISPLLSPICMGMVSASQKKIMASLTGLRHTRAAVFGGP